MPTVKLQNGRVILKDGKVSCSCCAAPPEPSCCMYPASGLENSFFAADLPATLYGKWGDRADGTFTKSGDEYTLGTVTIRRNTGGTAWEFYDSTDDATRAIGNCLIRGDGGLTPGDDTVEDQFNAIYHEDSTLQDYTRKSLCVWGNTPVGPFYSSWTLTYSTTDNKWYCFSTGMGVGPFSGVKTGAQDSPAGTYPMYNLISGVYWRDIVIT
jgi:hypothetical protein